MVALNSENEKQSEKLQNTQKKLKALGRRPAKTLERRSPPRLEHATSCSSADISIAAAAVAGKKQEKKNLGAENDQARSQHAYAAVRVEFETLQVQKVRSNFSEKKKKKKERSTMTAVPEGVVRNTFSR